MDISPLPGIRFANIFSYSVGCFFILLMVFFAVQKVFSFMYSHLFIFSFVAFVFGVKSKQSLSTLMSRSLPPVFSSRTFIVSGLYIQVFNPFWVIFVWYKIVVQFYSFACGCLFSHHLLKRVSFPHCIFLAPLP